MLSPHELREVCQAGKDRDPGWYRIHRRLSIHVTARLLETRITLGQISTLMLSLRARSRGYFQPRFVERMLHEHSQGTRNWHTQIWNLMMLESWHRAFVDESAAAMVRPA